MSQADSRSRDSVGAKNVYIQSDQHAWIPAFLVKQDQETATVSIPQYESEEFIITSDGGKGVIGFKSAIVNLKDYPGQRLPLQNCDSEGTLKEVDDMEDLFYLHEAAMLYNLKKRHCHGQPYTRLGDIVIAVNPYQRLEDLYTDKLRMQYAQKIVWDQNDRDPRLGLPPHPYEVSALCYKGLALERKNQSILVTGISGAGKTETVKICMEHIVTMQQDPNDKSSEKSMLVKRILESNRILEAFGNASTRHNNNSSRFGKYTKLQFHHVDVKKPGDRPRAVLAGSTCEVVLLEKSRVIFHERAESTFHAFYQLLSAPDDKKAEIWKGLRGTRNESFAYVGASPYVLIDGKDDSAHFVETNAALELIGITGEKYLTLWRAIAACLQLGNLRFTPQPDEDRTVVVSIKELNDLAELIGCDSMVLGKAFTERTMKTWGEEYKVPIPFDVAKQNADAFAKEIYAKTFLWLVRAINDATCAEINYPGSTSIDYGLIGLLDMFGFESLPVNGFEQFCINYCNEKLQQKFNCDMLRTVEEEYKAEGLNLDDIKYDDNSDVLDLIEGEFGIVKQLNSSHLHLSTASRHPCFFQEKPFDSKFGIRHYAGEVVYNTQHFIERNTDSLPIELLEAAKMCKNEIISNHLDDKQSDTLERTKSRPTTAHLQTQLTNMIKGLNQTRSRYVCCIKPNTRMRKLVLDHVAMDHVATMTQLQGTFDAVLMPRSRYPLKLLHSEVVERFGILNKGNGTLVYPDVKSECEDICRRMFKYFETTTNSDMNQFGFVVGKRRVHFMSGCLEYLELERSIVLRDLDHATIDSCVSCSSTNVRNKVYIRSGKYAWIPARLVEQDEDTARVTIPQYESEAFIMSDGGKGVIGLKSAVVTLMDYHDQTLPFQNCGSDGILKHVDDMVDLPYLHEAAILYNLKKRHCDGKPYTRLGDIVIAVNPYQRLEDLYTDNLRLQYAQTIVWDQNDRDPRLGLPPHPYEVSAQCYKGLVMERKNQSILVTGISGAGKTETVKVCMNHIATMQQDPNEKSTEKSMVVKRILECNRLLEAFGNAKTRHNDNSSRFGKYTKLQFHHIDVKKPGDRPRAVLAGSTCEVVLLEKSRVVFHDDTERTYHAFYQLLSAAEDKKAEIWIGLKGTKYASFACVGTSPDGVIDGKEDSAHFIETSAALELIGICGETYVTLWRAIAACLQLGNLTFKPQQANDDRTDITSIKELNDLAELIGCDSMVLEMAFTERTMKTRNEEYKVPLRFDMAKESADAFAKEIYTKTFLWLVRAINDATCAENNYPGCTSIDYGLNGLLDLFGFESLPVNGFEQICINYCNEKLHQKFICDIFQTVEEEYKAEGLNRDDVKDDDNSDVLDLIERNTGLISNLNEESIRPKGTDEAFIQIFLATQKSASCLFINFRCRFEFSIYHYAGSVVYRVEGLVARNTDTLPIDIAEAAKLCKNEVISKHLDNNKCSNGEVKDEEPLGVRARPKRPKANLVPPTVMTRFKFQLARLVKSLNETQSHYVCCIIPNTQKQKLFMEHVSTLKQLRGAGVVSAAFMSRSTFSSKLLHSEVVERYRMLNKDNGKFVYPDVKSECEDICRKMLKHIATTNKSGKTKPAFAIGKTRAYFRSECLEYLESERSKHLVVVDDATVDDSWVYCSSTDYI